MQATTRTQSGADVAPQVKVPTVTVVTSDGGNQVLQIPTTRDQMRSLLARRREISLQLNSVTEPRDNLIQQLQTMPTVGSEGVRSQISFLDARVIQRLIALRQTSGKTIVASSYADTVGVPALFSRSVFQELLSLDDKAGAKSIVLRNRERVGSLSFPKGRIDIDTWQDWEKLNGGSASPKTMGTMGTAVTKIAIRQPR